MNARASPVLSDAQRNHRRPDAVRRRREGRHCKLRIATLNIGTLTGKGREVAAIMAARRVEILCLQETRWTGGKSGGKARNLGDGCKLYYSGGKQPRNGVGICLNEYWQDKVISVERKSDRIIKMKLVIPGMSITIISTYAPQQGCSQAEKDLFWNQMDDVMSGMPSSEEVIVAGNLNGHIGRDRSGVERWHGGWTIGRRNEEGGRVLEMAQAYDLALVNTFFPKKEEHLITFKSGRNTSVIDYIAIRRDHLGELKTVRLCPGNL